MYLMKYYFKLLLILPFKEMFQSLDGNIFISFYMEFQYVNAKIDKFRASGLLH